MLRIADDRLITRISPAHYEAFLGVRNGAYEFQAEFHTHWKYSKRLYYAFKPFWWAMHAWDWLLADRLAQSLSFGFSTLTAQPVAGAASPVDGAVENAGVDTWAHCRAGTNGTLTAQATGSATTFVEGSFVPGNSTYRITRSFFCFDTSALGASAVISAATFSVADDGTANSNTNTTTIEIVTGTPASTSNIATTDFGNVGATSFSSKNVSAYSSTNNTYNDFALNASGIANISLTGISKFAAMQGTDFSNATPTGLNNCDGRYADTAGTSADPKLVVTYTLPSPIIPSLIVLQTIKRAAYY